MTSWLLALWGRLPARLRRILAAIAAAVGAGFALFLYGRSRGLQEAQGDAILARGRREASRIRGLGAAGKDDEVQRELARATADARKRTGGKRR